MSEKENVDKNDLFNRFDKALESIKDKEDRKAINDIIPKINKKNCGYLNEDKSNWFIEFEAVNAIDDKFIIALLILVANDESGSLDGFHPILNSGSVTFYPYCNFYKPNINKPISIFYAENKEGNKVLNGVNAVYQGDDTFFINNANKKIRGSKVIFWRNG